MKKFAIAFFGLALSVQLNAGTQFEMVTTYPDGSEEAGAVSVQDGRLRIEVGESDTASMIYRDDLPAMIAIDHAEQRYMVIDKATMDNVAAQLNSARQQMEAALKDLPPAQRAMMEQMMMGRIPQVEVAIPEQTLMDMGSGGDVNGYSTRKYQMKSDGIPVRNLWVASWDQVEGGEELSQSFVAMSGFLQEMLAALPLVASQMSNPYELLDQLDGLPVRTVELDSAGQPESTSEVRSVTSMDFTPDYFEAPADYQRQEIPNLAP